MLDGQDVAEAVVLPQPNGGHDKEARLHAEEGVAQGDFLLFGRMRRVDHVDGRSVAEQRRELLAVSVDPSNDKCTVSKGLVVNSKLDFSKVFKLSFMVNNSLLRFLWKTTEFNSCNVRSFGVSSKN
jgi:hypothetical protein